MGISNGVGTLAGMLCPVAVEFLTKQGVNYFKLYSDTSFLKIVFDRNAMNGLMYFLLPH